MSWPHQPGGPHHPHQQHHYPGPPPPHHQQYAPQPPPPQQHYPGQPPQQQFRPHPPQPHQAPQNAQGHVPVRGLPGGWNRAPGWPLPGEQGTRWMTPAADAGMYLRRMLMFAPGLLMFFVVILLIASIFFETAAAGTGMIGGTVVGFLATAALAMVPLAKVRRMVERTHVISSPVGVELRDHLGFQVRMRWADMIKVGPTVDNTASDPVEVGPFMVRVHNIKSHGVIGWGERVIPPAANGMRAALAQQPRHPETGAELVAISFPAAGSADASNPLLQEVHRYRPDLVVFGG